MKKVCFVIPRAYYLFNPEASNAKDKVGGAQKQAYLLSTGLAEDENFDVHFLVADFGQANFEIKNNVKLHKSFNFSKNIFNKAFRLLKTLKKINAEIYFFHSADAGVAFAVFYVKTFLKKTVFYLIASDAELSSSLQKKYSGFFTEFFMKFIYKNADILAAQTKQQAILFEKNRKRKPDFILKNIFLNKHLKEKKYDKNSTILWIGRLAEIKKPELYLNLAKKYPEKTFVMIAPVVLEKKEYGKKIQKQAEKINNLQYIDYVKPSEIYDYCEKAQIYVMTSEFEGFSNTMAEAMQAKCPILSYNVNPDNILYKFECGFCAEKNIEKFYSDFEKLLKNTEICKTFGKNGANYIAENHRKEQIIDSFKKLL